MKKIFDKVRRWTGLKIPDKHIQTVLEALADSNVYYPSDFTVSLTKEQKSSSEKANKELNEKTKSLFYELTHEDWGNSENAGKNLATIIFGLVLAANEDTLEKEVKNEVKIIPFDIKGGKEDVDFVKGIEYPISLKRVQDIKNYLDTKVTHAFPEVMFEDIRHTKKFTDVPWGVLTHLVSYYHAYNGDTNAKSMLGYVKRKMLKEVPMNKRGANIGGGKPEDETEVTVTQFNKYFAQKYGYIGHSLTNKEVEKYLNQDTIKRVSLRKKADYFQDYLLANGLADDVQLKDGGKVEEEAKKRVKQRIEENLEKIKQGKYKNGTTIKKAHTYNNRGEWKFALQTHDALMVGSGDDVRFLEGKIKYKKSSEHLVAYFGNIKVGYWDYGLNEGYIYPNKFKYGTTIKKTYPKTDLSKYTLKELYALYGTAERNWKNDDGAEYHRVQAEISKRENANKSDELIQAERLSRQTYRDFYSVAKKAKGGGVDDDLLDFDIPTWALSSLVNGDDSGLQDEDIEKLNEFTDKIVAKYGNSNFMIGSEEDMESHFKWGNDVERNIGGDVVTMYLRPSKKYADGGGVDENNKFNYTIGGL